MTQNEKAVANLNTNDSIGGAEDNSTVYIIVDDIHFELSEFEIKYQADRYDDKVTDGYFD